MLLNTHIPARYIFKKVRVEVMYVLIIGLLTNLATHLFRKYIPEMPIAIPAFIGTAISVLLSFKLNQSYDRWWEARKIWGSIVNESRSFVLQLQSFIKDDEASVRQLTLRQIAWNYALGNSLRGLDPMPGLERYLDENDMNHLRSQSNKPLAILQLNTLHLLRLRSEGRLELFAHVQINNTMVNFSNAMGMCERIKATVFPTTYRHFLHWVIYLFCVTLAISLNGIDTYFELPLLVAISGAFFLLEKSATHLQDPFSNLPTDTAVTTIATNIEINLRQLIGDNDIPNPYPPESFYAL
ncbi:bestrophin family protein [Rurimicrobium arvi]